MSQINEADQIDESKDSSSSCSTITLTATTTSGSSSSLASSSSDTNDNQGTSSLQPHRHCHRSSSHSDAHPKESIERDSSPRRLDMIDRLESTKGQLCDTRSGTSYQRAAFCQASSVSHDCANQYSTECATTQKTIENSSQLGSVSSSSKLKSNRLLGADDVRKRQEALENAKSNTITNLGSSYSNLSSTSSNVNPATSAEPSRRTLKPAPSPSPSLSTIDTNNNRNANSSSVEGLTSKRTIFSKSASGSRLITKSRSNVCDCLSQDCSEKRHSNRRRFIEHYYNSRTQLPSADTSSSSSFNISTPLNKLSECDAITSRLLSSPIRTSTLVESPTHKAQLADVEKSRRASLGTNTMTDQVFLYSSNAFSSIESDSKKSLVDPVESPKKCDEQRVNPTSGQYDIKLKQQQGRSFSVCNEETLGSRMKNINSNHSANFSRAVSLACESRASSNARRSLTIIPLFGCDIKSLEQFAKLDCVFPPVIHSAVDHILSKGIDSTGIFRKSGVKSRILSLRQRIESNQNAKIDELNQNNEFSIYDIADLVKMWFRELKPVPLMNKELIKLISSFLKTKSINTPQSSSMKRGISSHQDSFPVSSQSDHSKKLFDSNLKNSIDSITTPLHKALLFEALDFLSQISERCDANQMTSQNLAICLTPSLCETESDQNSILIDQKVLEYCIDNHLVLFGGRHKP